MWTKHQIAYRWLFCVGSRRKGAEDALAYMQRVLSADITPSAKIDLQELLA